MFDDIVFLTVLRTQVHQNAIIYKRPPASWKSHHSSRSVFLRDATPARPWPAHRRRARSLSQGRGITRCRIRELQTPTVSAYSKHITAQLSRRARRRARVRRPGRRCMTVDIFVSARASASRVRAKTTTSKNIYRSYFFSRQQSGLARRVRQRPAAGRTCASLVSRSQLPRRL